MLIITERIDPIDALYEKYLRECLYTRDFTIFREADLDEGIKDIWNFIKEIAKNFSLKIKDLVQAFKNSEIFKFFASFEFKFSKLVDAFKMVYKVITDITKFIPKKLAGELLKLKNRLPPGLQEALKNGVLKVDQFLKSKGKFGCLILACFIAWLFMHVGFVGDVSYDFDAGDIINASKGKLTFASFFLGDKGDFSNRDGSASSGLTYIALIILGKLGYGAILPYNQFSNGVFLAVSLLTYFAKEYRLKLSKGKDSPTDIRNAELSLA